MGPASMRPAVVIVALACVASAAQARDVRESRYGPRSDRQATASDGAAAYNGPMLAWSGKAQDAAPPPVAQPPVFAPPSPVAPEPSAPWRKLGALPAQPAPQAAPAAPLPTSLYAPAHAAAPRPAGSPSQVAMAPPSSDALGPSLSRTYSVGRQYGLQPDALPPLKPNGMVFIAPSDPQPAARGEPPRHGSAEWLAGGPAGNEAERDAGKDLSLR